MTEGEVVTISLDGRCDERFYRRGVLLRWCAEYGQGVLGFDPPDSRGRSAVEFWADAVRAIDDVPLSFIERACLCVMTLGASA